YGEGRQASRPSLRRRTTGEPPVATAKNTCPRTGRIESGYPTREVPPMSLFSPAPPSAATLSPAVRLCEVTKEWTSGKSLRVCGLRGVSLEVRRGEKVALLGKSGSGKSTLLNLLGGLDRPTSGRIEVEGHDLARLNSKRLAGYRLRTVGMIFQSFHLVPSRSARGNVELPLVFGGIRARD